MRRLLRIPVVLAAGALFGLALCDSSARASETVGDKTIDELIVELEKRGVVLTATREPEPTPAVGDEGDEEANELLKKLLAWSDRFDFYGDFRGRFEGFVFNEDSLGNNRKDVYGWWTVMTRRSFAASGCIPALATPMPRSICESMALPPSFSPRTTSISTAT